MNKNSAVSALHEMCLSYGTKPLYTFVSEGTDNNGDPLFKYEVQLSMENTNIKAIGAGLTRPLARENAAEIALKKSKQHMNNREALSRPNKEEYDMPADEEENFEPPSVEKQNIEMSEAGTHKQHGLIASSNDKENLNTFNNEESVLQDNEAELPNFQDLLRSVLTTAVEAIRIPLYNQDLEDVFKTVKDSLKDFTK